MLVTTIGFVPLSPLSIVSEMVMLESSQWLGKNILRSSGKTNSRKAWVGTTEIMLKTALNAIQSNNCLRGVVLNSNIVTEKSEISSPPF